MPDYPRSRPYRFGPDDDGHDDAFHAMRFSLDAWMRNSMDKASSTPDRPRCWRCPDGRLDRINVPIITPPVVVQFADVGSFTPEPTAQAIYRCCDCGETFSQAAISSKNLRLPDFAIGEEPEPRKRSGGIEFTTRVEFIDPEPESPYED